MVIWVSGGGLKEPGRITETRIPMDDGRYVWIVHYDNYGDRWLHGVYDSEEKVAEFRPQDPERPWHCDYDIVKARLQ